MNAPAPTAPSTWRDYLTPLNVMMLAVPAAAAVRYGGGSAVWVFAAAGLAIVPLAGYMGKATEALAERFGPAAGGLLNASFGNAAELFSTFPGVTQVGLEHPRPRRGE